MAKNTSIFQNISYISYVTVAQWYRVLGYKSNECWFIPHLYSLVYSIHGTSRIKLRILECFTLYLRNAWSINLQATEIFFCGLYVILNVIRGPSLDTVLLKGILAAFFHPQTHFYVCIFRMYIHICKVNKCIRRAKYIYVETISDNVQTEQIGQMHITEKYFWKQVFYTLCQYKHKIKIKN